MTERLTPEQVLLQEIKALIPCHKSGRMVETWRTEWDKVSTLRHTAPELERLKHIFTRARSEWDQQQQLKLEARRRD